MFSGYKQNQTFVYDVLVTTEKYLYEHEGRDRALDKLDTWDEGDLYRLVAAFLGGKYIGYTNFIASLSTTLRTIHSFTPQLDSPSPLLSTRTIFHQPRNFAKIL
jgi:hypothetical protein